MLTNAFVFNELTVNLTEYYSNENPIKCLGCIGVYAQFVIKHSVMQDGSKIDKLLVAHEGNWTKEESMFCYDEYKHYEDVQNDLGKGLILKRKGYSKINYRSLFLYEFDNTCNDHILAVPATGEEIDFEIYGVNQFGDLVLLVKMEL